MFLIVLKFNFSADLLFDILDNAMNVLSYLFLTYFPFLGGTNLLKLKVNKRIKYIFGLKIPTFSKKEFIHNSNRIHNACELT